ncbi:MAG: CDP-alcohol phosphatidyltransferase family protein [Actinomycetota bacterium]|nr:CDP-alcohol phosphatidyltransferase family protein [Actinomycetota bacterium]
MAVRAVSRPLAQLPNALTVLRLAAIPVFVALMLAAEGRSWPAVALFTAAGVTDQVDGWLARRWRVESAFGRVADPLADRLLIDAAVVLLWFDGRLPWPALAIILVRDLVLVAGYKLVMPRGYELSVSPLGKAATWVLYAAIFLVLVTPEATEWPLLLFWGGLALAVAAGGGYLVRAWRYFRA